MVKNKTIQVIDEMKPRYTSGSNKFHPRVSMLLREVVAIVRGRMLLMYCSNIGIPSTGQMTPTTDIKK